MKKILLTLVVAVFAVGAMSAQNTKKVQATPVAIEKKHECKDHKDGQACNKPANQQCDDCKAKAAAAQKCEKAEGMKHECKEGMQKCEKAEGMKHECKDHKDGQACNKPADQQCPDCKDKAKKN
ncbi:MAG: hypothetical protein IJS04_06185 [Muribaculaceae bacterium]|nr:hypothetical protein [Muribaculaceae bacterium]